MSRMGSDRSGIELGERIFRNPLTVAKGAPCYFVPVGQDGIPRRLGKSPSDG